MENIVYYSLTGTVIRYMQLNELSGVQIKSDKKVPTSKYMSYLWYAFNNRKVLKISYDDIDLKEGETIKIITPIWAGYPALPVQSFINENLEKLQKMNVEMVAISGGGHSKTSEKYAEILPELKLTEISARNID